MSGSPVTSSVIGFFGGLCGSGSGKRFRQQGVTGWGTRRTCDIGCVLEFLVISAPAGGVDQAAGDTRDEQLVGDGKLNDRVERFFPRREHRVEFLCLRDRAGEPVKHKAAKSKPHFIRIPNCCAERQRTRSCTACCSRVGRESYLP